MITLARLLLRPTAQRQAFGGKISTMYGVRFIRAVNCVNRLGIDQQQSSKAIDFWERHRS